MSEGINYLESETINPNLMKIKVVKTIYAFHEGLKGLIQYWMHLGAEYMVEMFYVLQKVTII